MTGPPLIAIFGAAILPSGPSRSLLRRIGYGLTAARAHPEARVLCSGGVGRFGPSEASVMVERLLADGVAPERLIADEASLDTLDSVVVASRWSRRLDAGGVIVCSDAYHVPRIRLMLGLLGVESAAGPRLPGRGGSSLTHWTKMSLREGLAIPYDLAILLVRRRKLAAEAGLAS
ncbi:YdcF family protein [Phenylobacterium sp.]|uniref:YdcF family protein n=1 Tax=Phenylobacterium sp. TaxID=1871053 RepID=UPI002810BB4A|nr:YdcF family protein [Phenylobacterium sp.]